MEHSSIKDLVRIVVGTSDYAEFALHLSSRGAGPEAITGLWNHYRFLAESSYLKPWVRENLLEGIKLDELAYRYNFTIPKIRTDVHRATKQYAAIFPFDLYILTFSGGITEEILESNETILKRLWKKYSPLHKKAEFSDIFAINVMDFISRPEKYTISDEEFLEMRNVFSRISNEHLRTLMQLSNQKALRYGLYLLTHPELDTDEDIKRSHQLKNAVGIVTGGE